MFGLGIGELCLVGGLAVLLFGGKKIPELGGALAKGIKNFQSGLHEQDSIEEKSEKKS
ncbi:Sec-independent protein translocase TatA [Halobacteriovorax marinus]|uniref:Sec-independent protein translocase protein TatA n=1 Tax=Halobacteriovorax marinus TaxID=97084 RepID=A0A1Y5FBB7_9BACT|nr:Sec-independent protein translocase TatA [Halobacteriovorax marinus]